MYELDEEELLQKSERSANVDDWHANMMKKVQTRVINTQLWNPLIFAIFYGRTSIVKYILQLADSKELQFRQHVGCLLTDPFKIQAPDYEMLSQGGTKFVQSEMMTEPNKEGDYYQHMAERTALVPLILTIATRNVQMFQIVWEHSMLWNKPVYLVLLSNVVYESENTQIINVFLKSAKTKSLFNSISQAERRKFVSFTQYSLEKYIVDDSMS